MDKCLHWDIHLKESSICNAWRILDELVDEIHQHLYMHWEVIMNDNSYEETMTSSYIGRFVPWVMQEGYWMDSEWMPYTCSCASRLIMEQRLRLTKMKIEDWIQRWSTHKRKSCATWDLVVWSEFVNCALCTNPYYVLPMFLRGDSHGLASREIFQVSMRGWHQVLMIMVDKGKFNITIPKDYMLEACGWSHDGQVKMNTKQSLPYCVWRSYLKTSPMSFHSTWSKKKLQLQAQVKGSSQRY